MRPSTFRDSLIALIPTKVPVWAWGQPGIGKSDIVKQASTQLGLEFRDVRAVLLDPVDLRGLPTIGENGRCRWAVPDFLPMEGQGVLFLDELSQAPPLVQAALLQLTLSRQLGEYVLPDDWSIVAASNRQEDRAGGHRVITPLMNRFLHLDVEVHNEDWQDWAVNAGVRPEIRSFINARPNLLHKFDPTSGARAFPTPRSWAFVSTIMPAVTDDTMFDLVGGCVGSGPAAEFVAFAKVYRSLPDVDGILANPSAAPLPTEPDVLYAVCGAIVEKCRTDAKKTKSGPSIKYANRLPKEFGVLLFRDIVKVDREALMTDEGRQFLKTNRDALVAA